ncbi:MAG: 30S ribosomal protein S12 methylthiotransferase RimO [Bacteroidales bacterium]|nr:30S ribosomal protein S12 methylthiotransferase RimO [Bacteroidales bacterium]MCF8392124.1 30S ribosomal protein S12 methylthiotransferase RimO [Bacteroidales bacterium]
MKINLITLGCFKNLVDSERIIHQIERNGHTVLHNSEEFSEAVIINTCGFILDAKTESIENILRIAEAKKKGLVKKIIVMGCLSQRYSESMKEEMPEIDSFYGVNDHEAILADLESNYYAGELHRRSLLTPTHYAYLKISEGCNRNCAFCAIPSIRGKQISVSIPDLIKEAKELTSKGVKEIILIAQDLTSYGTDIYSEKALPKLIGELVKIEEIQWLRLHYTYPYQFPADEIIQLMKDHPKICKYLDIPVQHISDSILKNMNRGHGSKEAMEIIHKFRKEIPDIAVRTTLITGFPGETAKDFSDLKELVASAKFDRLGVFTYSHEEGTPAYEKFKDNVPEKLKISRMEELLAMQESISLENNQLKLNKVFKVLIDNKEGEFYIGRTEFDSPEVDNEVLIPAENTELQIGEFWEVEIYDATEFDLFGRLR